MKKRKYEEPWQVLKSTGALCMQIVGVSLSKATIEKYVRTYRKAIQKEKYNDTNFRIRYPNAIIETNVDYENAKLYFVIHFNDYSKFTEEQFNVRLKSKAGSIEE